MDLTNASKLVFDGLKAISLTEVVDENTSNGDKFECQVNLYYNEKNTTEIIDSLPKLQDTKNQITKEHEQEHCAICLLEMDTKCDNLTQGRRCQHVYHTVCLKDWLINDSSLMLCPLCRKKI